MTTPSRYRKLNTAAEQYAEFQLVALQLCHVIKQLHGGLRFEGEGQNTPGGQEMKEVSMAICKAVETKFHEILDPLVNRLEEIDRAIKANLPKPPGTIILPGDDIN